MDCNKYSSEYYRSDQIQGYFVWTVTNIHLNIIDRSNTGLLCDPIDNIQMNICYSPYKVALYSCHDSSLVPMLAAMGCYDSQWPSYSAYISIELHEDNKGQHWVKVSYCDKVCVDVHSKLFTVVRRKCLKVGFRACY